MLCKAGLGQGRAGTEDGGRGGLGLPQWLAGGRRLGLIWAAHLADAPKACSSGRGPSIQHNVPLFQWLLLLLRHRGSGAGMQ